MKKIILSGAVFVLILALIVGCGKTTVNDPSNDPTNPTTEQQPTQDGDNGNQGGDAFSHYINEVYAQQIGRYYTAISQKWDEGTCIDNRMSAMIVHYYEGNPLDNIGFGFVDLDGDGVLELIIGAIQNAQQDSLVFEIWSLKNGNPVMLVQSGSRNRYYLQYAEEDELWYVAYEAENGAANRAVYYLQLFDGVLEVSQGVIFDAVANEENPWFMAYDLDWDVSNDTPIDEDLATAVMNEGRKLYIATEYFAYRLYK